MKVFKVRISLHEAFSRIIIIVFFVLLLCNACKVNSVNKNDDIDLYRTEVIYRMKLGQIQFETELHGITCTKKYCYEAEPIMQKVSILFEEIRRNRGIDWWNEVKERLSLFWNELPALTEDLSQEKWIQGNFDRFLLVKGFELMSRPLRVRLNNSLLEVDRYEKRGQLIEIWKETERELFSIIEYPDYDALYKKTRQFHPHNNHWQYFKKTSGRPLMLAHRGWWYLKYPENSMVAFRDAYLNGADGIECDLRLSRDGKVFILHDDNLERLTGKKINVSNVNGSYLKKLRLRNPSLKSKISNESPVELAQLLEEFAGKMLLWLELKPDGGGELPQKVGDLLEEYKVADKVIVSSFSHDMLTPLRFRFAELSLAYEFDILKESDVKFFLTAPDRDRLIVSADHPEVFTPQVLSILTEAGIQISSYTPNRFDALKSALDHKIRFIQTDRPDRLFIYMKEGVQK